MPGLIESIEYTAAKKKLCDEDGRYDDMFDAAEWELQCTVGSFDAFPVINGGPLRFHRSGRVIVVFGHEVNGGEDKVLLIDGWAGSLPGEF